MFWVEYDRVLHCHEQSGNVLPMLSTFIVSIFEFINVYDEK